MGFGRGVLFLMGFRGSLNLEEFGIFDMECWIRGLVEKMEIRDVYVLLFSRP